MQPSILVAIDQLSHREIPPIYATTHRGVDEHLRPWAILLQVECELLGVKHIPTAIGSDGSAHEYRGRAELVRFRVGFEDGVPEAEPGMIDRLVADMARRLKGTWRARKLLYEKCEESGGAGVIGDRRRHQRAGTARARRARKGRLPVLRRPSIPPDRPVGQRRRDDHPRPGQLAQRVAELERMR